MKHIKFLNFLQQIVINFKLAKCDDLSEKGENSMTYGQNNDQI